MERMVSYCQLQLNNKNWFPWLFESIHGGVLCTGAVCPPVSRGKNKGKPNYRAHDKSTLERVFVPANKLPEAYRG